MSVDRTELGEGSSLAVALDERHDRQHWHCHTQLEKVTIPAGLRKTTLDELEHLSRLLTLGHSGITSVTDGSAGTLTSLGALQRDLLLDAGVEPELVEIEGNLLVYGGASAQWQTLIGNGTTTAGQALTYFSNAQAAIGVGDSTTAAAATQTDLVATTNKLRVAMDATYPAHTDGTVVGAASAAFKATFGTAQANWAWQEWGVFNSSTLATGRMLQRKVESLGTKTSASTWALTLTLSLA